MAEPMQQIYLDRDEIAIEQGGKRFWLRPSGDMPELDDLEAKILVTRLRWWADKVDDRARQNRIAESERVRS